MAKKKEVQKTFIKMRLGEGEVVIDSPDRDYAKKTAEELFDKIEKKFKENWERRV